MIKTSSQSANTHLRTIIWVSILSLVLAYIAGMIHFGIVYLNNLSESAATRIESHIHEQMSELLTEILLNQNDAIQERVRNIELYLNQDPHIQNLCATLNIADTVAFGKSCPPNPEWNRETQIPINSGSHNLGSLGLHYTLSGVFSKIFATIAPIILFVIAISMCVIFAIFRTAERIVIGPFARAIRQAEQQDATHKAMRMLAHDVRRPFSMLAIMLGEIKQAHSMEEIALLSNRYHNAVHKALYDITQQLNEFVTPTRELTGRITTSIAALIKSSTESVHFIFKAHKRPEFNLQTEDALITCIPSQLTRVFENILANAYEACGPSGSINICLAEQGDSILLSIANTGPRIPEQDLAEIFSDTYTKGKTHGNGLGLAIAKRFVEQNGGSIACENIGAGGVAFHMKFPKAQPSSAQTLHVAGQHPISPQACKQELRQSLRLLIVEDEMIYQDALLLCIDRINRKESRIIPMLAQSSDDALRFAHEWQPHAIICDQNLGDGSLSGVEIAMIIHEKYPHIPVLLLSNGILDSAAHFNNNMTTAVQKPIDIGTLELFLQTLRTTAPSSRSHATFTH